MQWLYQLTENEILITVITAWAISCILKGIICAVTGKTIRPSKIFGSGGMPSSHSATVSALAMTVGLFEGFDTSIFAVSAVLAFVVMYDASGVRRAAGQHARFINMLMKAIMEQDPEEKQTKLKEILGHTPLEVMAGAIVGITVAIVSFANFK